MEGGYRDSRVRMNAWIAKQGSWGVEQLEARSAIMQDRFCALWPTPEDDVIMKVDGSNCYTLDEMQDLTGRKINAWTFMGDRHAYGVWKDMYADMLSILSDLDAAKFRKGAMSIAAHQKTAFSERNEGPLYVKVLDNLYARNNLSVMNMAINLSEIFDEIGIDHEELVVELVNESDKA